MSFNFKAGVFNQRDVEFITKNNGLISDKIVCINGNANCLFIGTDCGLNYTKKDGSFGSFPCGKVGNIYIHNDGNVYFSSGSTLYIFKGGKIKALDTVDDEITGIDGEESVFAVTLDNIYELVDGKLEHFYENWKPAKGITVAKGKIREYADDSVMIFPGKRKHWRCIISDHSDMPRFKINCIKFDAGTGFLYIGTDKGAFVYDDGTGWYGHEKITALPEEEVFDIDINESGKIAFATETGVVVINKGKTKYLPATRYVPCEKVNCIKLVGSDIYAGTDEGLSRIYEYEMTLEKKADYFYKLAEKYFVRKNGYVVGCRMKPGMSFEDSVPSTTDNDGLWTQMYIMALAYNYAVTGNKEALKSAKRSLEAMIYLTKVTGIKGFTARAVRFPDEPCYGEKLDLPIDGGEWHKSPVYDCEWLGETSSDEMTGHFAGFCAYYDFCANQKEKAEIKKAVCDIMDHIIEHGYRLYDCDNLPTTWACWDPAELNGNNMWLWEKGVNSLEILTFLDVAYHVSGDEKYRKEFLRLAIDEHFLLNAAHHKREDGHETHIDDNLAMLCTLTLLRIEKDESIKSYIYMGLKHHWDYERIEKFPMWNFVYGVFCEDACDIDSAVKYLKDFPMNPTDKAIYNDKRKNIEYDTESEYWGIPQQAKYPFDIDERAFRSFSDNPFTTVGSGTSGGCSANFILPYWFGRYYGIID